MCCVCVRGDQETPIVEVVNHLILPTVIGRVSQIDPKYEAMMGEMQLLMLAGWLQRKRGTSGCSGGWFQTIIGTLHYLKCI